MLRQNEASEASLKRRPGVLELNTITPRGGTGLVSGPSEGQPGFLEISIKTPTTPQIGINTNLDFILKN